MEKVLKVSDLVNFKEEDYKLGKQLIIDLDELCVEYSETVGVLDPNKLDTLKRRFVSVLSTFTDIFSKVKAFKGANHSYLEDARKQFKAEAYSIVRSGYTETIDGKKVIHEAVKSTEAGQIVYKCTYYIERVALMEDIKAFFVRVDEKHSYYSNVMQWIQQTISIVSKDYEYARYSK